MSISRSGRCYCSDISTWTLCCSQWSSRRCKVTGIYSDALYNSNVTHIPTEVLTKSRVYTNIKCSTLTIIQHTSRSWYTSSIEVQCFNTINSNKCNMCPCIEQYWWNSCTQCCVCCISTVTKLSSSSKT